MSANVHFIDTVSRENETDHSVLAELDDIINNERVVTLFQPIFDLDNNNPFAYEALLRGPEDSVLHMPDAVFHFSQKYNRVMELDRLCRKKAIENFKQLGLVGKLTINVSPGALISPNFKSGRTIQLLREYEIPMDQVILELTEQQNVDHSELKAAARYYQDMGFSIALDDLGAGYSSLRLLAELKPDYIKLDKFFIADIHQNDVAADFVKLIADMADRVNCQVVAEGIETEDELAFIRNTSIKLAQGYLLGRPDDKPAQILPIQLRQGKTPVHSIPKTIRSVQEKEQVGSLHIHPTETCSDTDLTSEILALFQLDLQLLTIPVIKDGIVVGALLRDEILNIYSTPYAHSLYIHATAETMMLRDPLVVQITDTLASVSQKATKRAFNQVYCPVIVCDGDTYVGTISIRELLKNITNRQIEYARHCNPLSGLPGNIRIESEVQGRIESGIPFSLLYFDLDNFKAYNDFYGYERGDQMIHLVAKMLLETAQNNEFVGHIGGDDFVMLMDLEMWEERIWQMLDSFSVHSAKLYDEKEQQQNYIETTDRCGDLKQFNLASLSVSALQCDAGRFQSHLQAAEVLAEIKHQSKKIEGNSLVTNRRSS